MEKKRRAVLLLCVYMSCVVGICVCIAVHTVCTLAVCIYDITCFWIYYVCILFFFSEYMYKKYYVSLD